MSTAAAFRAKETTLTVTDVTDILLEGPSTGFRDLVEELKSVTGVGTGPWSACVTVTNGTSWEVMVANVEEGTGAGGKDQVKRTTGTILRSSNGGSAINWGAGTKDVFISPDARKWYALLDALSTVGLVKRLSETSYSILAATANGESLITSANYAAMRALLDLEVGTDFNAYSARLADIAALAVTADNFVGGNASNLVLRTAAQVRTSLGLGTLYDRAIPTRSVTVKSSSGPTSLTTTEAVIVDFDRISFPGATDGATKYRVDAQVGLDNGEAGARSAIAKIRIGNSGTWSTDTVQAQSGATCPGSGVNGGESGAFISFEYTPASSSYKVSLGIQGTASDTIAVMTAQTWLRIEEVLD